MTREEAIKARSDFKKSLAAKTEAELNEMMEKIIEESKELDKTVSALEYDLNRDSQAETFEAIRYYINKQKVRWDYVTGLKELYNWFDVEQTKISFATLDTVLRLLGSLEFEGICEWDKVSKINDYFAPAAKSYREVTEKIYDIAERYQAVEGQLKMFQPVETTEPKE